MRIVAGAYKGRVIEAPKGEGTRPTVDRVREALFSSLFSQRGSFEGAIVLDAFAGSGALGIEALSRGAQFAAFYENNSGAYKALLKNLAQCGVEENKRSVNRCDILSNPPRMQVPPFDLVFLDPPYEYEPKVIAKWLGTLLNNNIYAPKGCITYEYAAGMTEKVEAAFTDSPWQIVFKRKYGKTGIAIMQVCN